MNTKLRVIYWVFYCCWQRIFLKVGSVFSHITIFNTAISLLNRTLRIYAYHQLPPSSMPQPHKLQKSHRCFFTEIIFQTHLPDSLQGVQFCRVNRALFFAFLCYVAFLTTYNAARHQMHNPYCSFICDTFGSCSKWCWNLCKDWGYTGC